MRTIIWSMAGLALAMSSTWGDPKGELLNKLSEKCAAAAGICGEVDINLVTEGGIVRASGNFSYDLLEDQRQFTMNASVSPEGAKLLREQGQDYAETIKKIRAWIWWSVDFVRGLSKPSDMWEKCDLSEQDVDGKKSFVLQVRSPVRAPGAPPEVSSLEASIKISRIWISDGTCNLEKVEMYDGQEHLVGSVEFKAFVWLPK